MALNLYQDDCANAHDLAALLRRAGHTVARPIDYDLVGARDKDHFALAKARKLTILTKNPADFLALHETDQEHSGILAVYQDNDVTKDMSDAEIIKAINNIEEAASIGGEPIVGKCHVLNNWRF